MQTHLSDDRLIEISVLESPSLTEQQHVASCARCDARRARLVALLDEVSAATAAEADAAFTPERLARQRSRILSHLQHVARPGKVIAFPAGHAHEPTASRTRPGTRWIAAAAVAGLVIGAIAGRLGHDFSFGQTRSPHVIVAHASDAPDLRPTANTATLREVSNTVSDEELLNQIEIAVNSPSAAALQPLDELTPLAWEVR